jgi:hypothetical protein
MPMLPLHMRPLAERIPGLISVTLPSRHRPDMLTASVHSLRTTARRPDLIEVLVAHDPDDPGTATTAMSVGARSWQAPTRFGYAGSARYYAALLSQAHGEWLLPTWGDDGLMVTEGWDEIVRAQPPGTILFVDGNYPGLTCFPIVHADVMSTLSRLTDLPALDTWFEDVGRAAGVLVHPDPAIYVLQDRFDLTGRNDDEVYRQGRTGYRPAEYHAEPARRDRAEDAASLRRARLSTLEGRNG